MRISQRLERLEKLVPVPDDPMTVIVSFVRADDGKPAQVQPEMTHARSRNDDWRLTREVGESLEDFTKRAATLAPRNELGVAKIVLDHVRVTG